MYVSNSFLDSTSQARKPKGTEVIYFYSVSKKFRYHMNRTYKEQFHFLSNMFSAYGSVWPISCYSGGLKPLADFFMRVLDSRQ